MPVDVSGVGGRKALWWAHGGLLPGGGAIIPGGGIALPTGVDVAPFPGGY